MDKPSKMSTLPLFVVILIDSFGWGVVYPILTPVIIQNASGIFTILPSSDIRNFWYEALIGLYCLCQFFTSPLLGSLSDRYGRKSVLLLCMGGMAGGFLISGFGLFIKSFTLLLFGRLLAGCTAGSLPIAQAALMDISNETEKPKRMSLVALCNVAGFAIGPMIGGILLDHNIWGQYVNYATPFLACALIAILGAVLLYYFFQGSFTGNHQQRLSVMTGFTNLRESWVNKKTRKLCFVFFLFMFAWALFFSTEPILLTERFNWSAADTGYFLSFGGVIFALGVVFLMPWLIKIFNLSNITTYSFLAMFICSIGFSLVYHPVWLWLLVTLNIAVPFGYIGIATLASQAVSIHEQGKIMGVINSFGALAWGLGPLFGGYLLIFGLKMTYFTAAGLFLLCLFWFKNKQGIA